jgi:hypothetical protein
MFRVLTTGGLTLVFTLVCLLTYTTVGDHTRTEVELQLHERLKGAHQSITHLQQLSHSATQARAEKVAKDPVLASALSQEVGDADSYIKRHEDTYGIVTKWKGDFVRQSNTGLSHEPGRLEDWNVMKPYFFNVVDSTGLIVADVDKARSFAKNAEGSEYTRLSEKYPALQAAISGDGESFYDVWDVGHQHVVVGVAPIRNGTTILGAVVIGYHINQNSEEYKRSLFADVGYFFQGKIQGSSTLGKEEQTLEDSAKKLISTYSGAPFTPIQVELKNRTILLRLGKVGGHKSAENIHFFVAVNWSDTLENAMSIRDILLIYIVVGLLISLLIFWVSLHYFVTPISDIEEGVVRITNGDLNYWFTYEVGQTDISPTLSQHLDIMVSILAGREMPELTNEEEDI